jgi:hypothetical protein
MGMGFRAVASVPGMAEVVVVVACAENFGRGVI